MFEVRRDVYQTRLTRFREAGAVFAEGLASALMPAPVRSTGDRHASVQHSAPRLREVRAAVERLRDAGAPVMLVQTFERAFLRACRAELFRGMPGGTQSR